MLFPHAQQAFHGPLSMHRVRAFATEKHNCSDCARFLSNLITTHGSALTHELCRPSPLAITSHLYHHYFPHSPPTWPNMKFQIGSFLWVWHGGWREDWLWCWKLNMIGWCIVPCNVYSSYKICRLVQGTRTTEVGLAMSNSAGCVIQLWDSNHSSGSTPLE